MVTCFSSVPMVAKAESVTPAVLRAVTAFASTKNFCDVKKASGSADCAKQVTICKAKDWETYVNEKVTFVGSSPQRISGNEPPDEILSFLRLDPEYRRLIPPLNQAACYCECPTGATFPACEGKQVGTPFKIGSDLQTYEECTGLCANSKSEIARSKCAGTLPSLTQADTSSVEGKQAINAALRSADSQVVCFTQGECSENNGTWEAYDSCPSGKGRCYAPPPTVKLNTKIGGIAEIQGLGNYIIILFRYMLSIVVFLTTIMFTWGAFRYFVGSSVGGTSRGKTIMKDAIIGMILLLCSVTILRTINPATLRMDKIKVYMVNTQSYVQSQFCKDLSASTKLADAGVPPSLKDKSVIDKSVTAYSIAPKAAECGHEYYIKDSTANTTCEGLTCDQESEVCVSCITGEPEGCQNQKSKKKVCDKQIFAGSVRYQDGRYPMTAYLVGVCGYAQVNDPYSVNALSDVSNQLVEITDVSFDKIAGKSGGSTTDVDVAGDAGYKFKFGSGDIQKAVSLCNQGGNSLRGFLLAIKYQDKGVALNDFALLSKQNCNGSPDAVYDGYASGNLGSEIASAFLCGLRKKPSPRFLASPETYWTQEELEAAVAGRHPQTCNFSLTAKSAPEDPGEKEVYCPVSATAKAILDKKPVCASGVSSGGPCESGSASCSLNGKLCKCFGANAAAFVWSCD